MTSALAAAAAAALALVECPICDGGGELRVCANDGSHGCSHVFDREYPCPGCNGEGEVTALALRDPAWCSDCGLSELCDRCAS